MFCLGAIDALGQVDELILVKTLAFSQKSFLIQTELCQPWQLLRVRLSCFI